MLQWMGGSRRKVAATHTSVKKRQQQYFEQRRRQQQQQQLGVGSDSCADEPTSTRPFQMQHRSLDILNLLNLSTAVPQHNTSCAEGKGDLAADSSTKKHNIPKEIGSLSGVKVEPALSKKTSFSVPGQGNQINDSKRTNNRTDLLTECTEQKLSVFDLVADDPATTNMEENPRCEAHMAFSVEGLGKIKTETPTHSPQRPDRTYPSWRSSPWKVSSPPDISGVRDEHDDLETEVDAILESSKMFQGGHPFRFSSGIQASGGTRKQRLPHSREYSHKPYISDSRNFFLETADFDNRRAHNENERNARSSFLDDREDNMYWKDQQPFEMESTKADFLEYVNDYLPGRSSAEDHPTKKRDYMGTTARPSTDDSLVQRRKIPEAGIEHPSSSRTLASRYFNSPEKFDFGDEFDPPVWSSFRAEKDKDSLSLRSDESCSSSAVWTGETTISRLKTDTTRQRRRDLDSFQNHGDKNDLNSCFAQKAWEERDGCHHLNRKDGLEDYELASNPERSKCTSHRYTSSSHGHGDLEKPGNWFAEGFTFKNMASGLPHFSESFTMTPPPSSSPMPSCRDPSVPSLDFLHSESFDIRPEGEKPRAFPDLELGGLHRQSSCISGSVHETWLPNVYVQRGPANDEHDHDVICLPVKRKHEPKQENKMKTEAVSSENGNENENERTEETRDRMSHKVNRKATQEQAGETSSSSVKTPENECSNYEKEEPKARHYRKRGTGTEGREMARTKASGDSLQQIVMLERHTLQLVRFERALFQNSLRSW
ncbi:PREDICTED: uncharacterized protein LOC104815825 isoform X3 [Tarenaya hassleriana]|uniref:uncharacterized protein LOC104815825 isoform X3 n=1 Tax=Tarenaya hassleriana TaxID=28532 RepID=UPI00053C44BF|nr:PREDICTED: uncharacterized protein LOC104815825 isoform X3 [Tarenaya hassleriana]